MIVDIDTYGQYFSYLGFKDNTIYGSFPWIGLDTIPLGSKSFILIKSNARTGIQEKKSFKKHYCM